MKRFGTEYGGFYYPENLDGLNKDSIIYCVGAGEDISHDIEIADKLKSKVYIFDPTPRAQKHVEYIRLLLNNKVEIKNDKRYGGGDDNYLLNIIKNNIKSDQILLYDYGLFTSNLITKFYKPEIKEHVSCSVVEGMKSENYFFVEMKTLKTIMKELGHKKIDLLKIDIEGCECEVIKQMIDDKIFPKYLSVDFDIGWTDKSVQNKNKCLKTINLLIQNGYKILHHKEADYSFQKIN